MANQITSDQVWQAVDKELFAVVGMVTAGLESRTVGIVYVVRHRTLYFGTKRDTWKARHIAANPRVSLTIPIAKRIPLVPWIRIPAATISFSGVATVLKIDEAQPDIVKAIFRGMAEDEATVADSCIIEVTPVGDFITYGVGVSLMQMRYPEQASGRAPVDERAYSRR